MDNLSGQKWPRVHEVIEAAAPTFATSHPTADFNPIKNAIAKLKAFLRKADERTVDGLCDAIGRLL